MQPIDRGKGVTESERYLARLADATFLKLWSYPNIFFDRKRRNNENGKEVCDLLVVCGDEVIIFSDKSITWPVSENLELSWSRWYRRAVKKSVDQIRGAERWLREFPDRLYLDPACSQRIPVPLPPISQRRVHGIAVALGAQAACSLHLNDCDGSLMIAPSIKGDAHVDKGASFHLPFALGDVDPDGPFVHVFDETALDLIMHEMDTISDFVRYLDERRDFIRGERFLIASGEADLLSLYMRTGGADHLHRFPRPEDVGADPAFQFLLPQGGYTDFISSEEYKRKKDADGISYTWDKLIGLFVDNVLAGTSVGILGELPSSESSERALRIMAHENRLSWRALGMSFYEALLEAERLGEYRLARIVMPGKSSSKSQTAYVFMILGYQADGDLMGGYEEYRQVRASMLETYCLAALSRYRNLKQMVGIAIDGASLRNDRRSGSEDLIAVEVSEWTSELEEEVRARQAAHDVLAPERLRTSKTHFREYPESATQFPNRQQRRAAERKARKFRSKAEPRQRKKRD